MRQLVGLVLVGVTLAVGLAVWILGPVEVQVPPPAPGTAAPTPGSDAPADGSGATDGAEGAEGVATDASGLASLPAVEEPPGADEARPPAVVEEEWRVTGLVLDEARLPVAGATVELARRAPWESGGQVSASAPTGPDGTFELVVTGKSVKLRAYQRELGLVSRQSVEVAPSAADDVELRLIEGGAVVGRVVDAEGEPVVAAAVRAETGGFSSPQIIDGEPRLLPGDVTADDGGRFLLEHLRPGHVLVGASAAGFLSGRPTSFELQAGERREGIEIVLQRPVTITGRVVDHAGAPVAGAEAQALQVDDGFGRSVFTRSAADAEGAFVLEGLSTGQAYLVVASAEGLAAVEEEPPRRHPGGARDVVVVLAPAASVSGRVLDEAGAPVAGARVGSARPGTAGFFVQNKVSASEDGAYHLPGLAAGDHVLHYSRSGARVYVRAGQQRRITLVAGERREGLDLVMLTPGQITGTVVDEDGAPVAGVEIQVTMNRHGSRAGPTDAEGRFVLEGVLDTAELQVTPPARMLAIEPSGRIEARVGDDLRFVLGRGAVLRGRVLNELQQPVTSFRVSVVPAGQSWPRWTALEPADGRFELTGLSYGRASLRVGAQAYAELVVPGLRLGRGEIDLGDLVLEAGSVLAGTVRSAAGDPVAQAKVTAERLDDAATNLGRDAGVRTDDDGAFTLANLLGGRHRIAVEHPDHARAWKIVQVPAASVDIVLGGGGGIAGQVELAGEPVLGAEVSATRRVTEVGADGLDDRHRDVPSDAEGAFRFDNLTPGRYFVSARMPGRLIGEEGQVHQGFLSTYAEVREGEVTDCLLSRSGCRLSVRVLSSAGEPWSGTVYLLGSGINDSRPLDEEGRAVFADVPADGYRLSITDIGVRPVVVPAAQEHEIEIRAAGGSLSGTIVRADGSPASGVRLSASHEGEERWGRSQPGGVFRIESLGPGAHDVVATAPGLGVAIARGVQIVEGQCTELTMTLAETCSVRVRVEDAQGSPVHRPDLSCRDVSGATIPTHRGRVELGGGEVELTGLPAGIVRIAAGAVGQGTTWVNGVELTPEATASVVLRLAGGRGCLQLRVRRGGVPVSGASFALMDAGGVRVGELDRSRQSRLQRTDAEGEYTTRLLPAGAYRVRLDLPAASQTVEVQIPADGSTTIVEVDL